MRSVLFAPVLLSLAACSEGAAPTTTTAAVDYTALTVESDPKAMIYNMVGRWFPEEEIKRLDDVTMTPERWCAREPTMILIMLDDIEVQCEKGLSQTAAIAKVDRVPGGGITVVLRAPEDAAFKQLTIHKAEGTTAVMSGGPCDGSKQVNYARFPKYETLNREVLGGRRCAQIVKPADPLIPGDD